MSRVGRVCRVRRIERVGVPWANSQVSTTAPWLQTNMHFPAPIRAHTARPTESHSDTTPNVCDCACGSLSQTLPRLPSWAQRQVVGQGAGGIHVSWQALAPLCQQAQPGRQRQQQAGPQEQGCANPERHASHANTHTHTHTHTHMTSAGKQQSDAHTKTYAAGFVSVGLAGAAAAGAA